MDSHSLTLKTTIPHLIRLWLCAKINNGFYFAVAAVVLDNGDDDGGMSTSTSRKMFSGHFQKIPNPETDLNTLKLEIRHHCTGPIGYSDNPASVTFFWSQKPSENYRIEWSLTVTLFQFPSTVTVTDRACIAQHQSYGARTNSLSERNTGFHHHLCRQTSGTRAKNSGRTPQSSE